MTKVSYRVSSWRKKKRDKGKKEKREKKKNEEIESKYEKIAHNTRLCSNNAHSPDLRDARQF
jgi:hypothetical protein